MSRLRRSRRPPLSGRWLAVRPAGIDGNLQPTDQLAWHWSAALRPRLDGLGDEEYFWEPVPGSWSVRRRAQSAGPARLGSGEYVYESSDPVREDGPVTTIAWRLAHIIVGCFGMRTASHFGGPPVAFADFAYAGTAAQALAQLDESYDRWISGVRALGVEGLARPCGPAEGPFAEYPLAALVLHIHREVIHHGAEIALLRDLYRDRPA